MIPVPEMTDLDIAFGNIKHLPDYDTIPEQYQSGRTIWNDLTSKWFFFGLKQEDFEGIEPKPGVDPKKAFRALGAIIGSFEPKHEHKEAGVAYLFSEWFQEVQPKSAPENAKGEESCQNG
jgi:hypothetical protein